jgi:hypothetical protein
MKINSAKYTKELYYDTDIHLLEARVILFQMKC